MDVLGWAVLIVGAAAVVFAGDLLLKRFFGGGRVLAAHEAPDAQAPQQALRGQMNGGGFGPQG